MKNYRADLEFRRSSDSCRCVPGEDREISLIGVSSEALLSANFMNDSESQQVIERSLDGGLQLAHHLLAPSGADKEVVV